MGPELRVFAWLQYPPTCSDDHNAHHKQGRHDALCPRKIKISDKTRFIESIAKDSCHQVTGDDEENIDTYKPSTNARKSKMVKNYQCNGERS